PGKASARGTGAGLEQNGCPARSKAARECSIDAPSAKPGAEAVTTRAIGLDEIPSVINEVDLLICSTGSSDAVLTYDGLAESIRRDDRPLLIVDIAVPRDVDPRLAELPDVFLYNIDDLNQLVAENIERRRMEIPRAEAIVDWEVEQFRTWRESSSVVPTIKLLRQHLSSVQEAEVKRYGKKFASSDRQQLEQFAQGMCNKILHQPIAFLRELSAENGSTEALAAVALIRRLFNLDAEEGDADE
ncbi:MAG: hypothetical protein QF662_07820, partial [Phycisphaerae bacterium]|nr:hypothetical protein [Phycisphaerae bacterium]